MNARRLSQRAPSMAVQLIMELIEQLNAYLHEAALYIIGSFSIASHYIIRLKNDFLIGFFQTFLISSIYTGLSNQSDFAWGWLLVPLGFGFYIFIYLMINKYITSQTLVNLARKILEKKSEKVVKLDSFGLYNILGG